MAIQVPEDPSMWMAFTFTICANIFLQIITRKSVESAFIALINLVGSFRGHMNLTFLVSVGCALGVFPGGEASLSLNY